MKPAPRLIGLSGYARSGKDTFAAALVERFDYQQRSFAEPLRQMLLAQNPIVGAVSHSRLADVVDLVGWEKAKALPEVRRLLQALGTEGGRKILGENIWVDTAMREVDIDHKIDELLRLRHTAELGEAERYVFSDVRFPNEAKAIVDRGGIVIRIEREGVEALNGHATEIAMDDWSFDYVIRNNGTVPELRAKAFDLIAKEQGLFSAKDYHRKVITENGHEYTLRRFGDGPYSASDLRRVDL